MEENPAAESSLPSWPEWANWPGREEDPRHPHSAILARCVMDEHVEEVECEGETSSPWN